MNPDTFAARMRSHEVYSSLKLMPGAWTVARVDGRGFSKLTSEHFDKPFDANFREHMSAIAVALVSDFQGVLAYVQSDEISLVLPPDWALFDRRVEKLVSLTAAKAAAMFSVASGQLVEFDSRLWVAPSRAHVVEYMRWRQADATRCALSTACYWTLREEGKSARQATSILNGATISQKNELLFERGVNFNELPVWQRRGGVARWETFTKTGFNPRTQEEVEVSRRRIVLDDQIPMKEEFGAYINALLPEG